MGEIINPTPVPYKDIDLSWMDGRVITEVSFDEPTLWHFAFGSEAGLGVECLWRIVEHGSVVLCGEDHGQQFGLPSPVDAVERATALLSGRRVAGAQLREATADVVIEFDGDCRLEIIPDSMGYESWQLRDPSGISYVAQGGGQICKWRTA
jgi:hypothetical protein